MDPVKRGDTRLARFYEAKRYVMRPELLRGRTVKSFMVEAQTTSLRTLIERTVVAFVPPQLPIGDGIVTCTHALAAMHSSGGFTLGVRVESSTPQPVVFIVGFCTNDARGAWGAIFGALNFDTDSFATSRTSVGVFWTHGGSWWLQHNYEAVTVSGVTFRIVSALDPGSVLMRSFFQSWVRTFDGQIKLQNMLALTDDHPELSVSVLNVAATSAIDPDEATLRLRGSLVFE